MPPEYVELNGSPHLSQPIAATAPAPEATPTPIHPIALSGRILLADDAPDNQRLLAHLLRRAGATVEVVENGVRALEAIDAADAANVPFDLLVTDRQMPQMDGPTLATCVRARGSSMPIIALTAHRTPDFPTVFASCGCDDFALKPIDAGQLVSMCAHWIGRRHERSERHAP